MTYLAPSLNWNLNRSIVLSILKLNVNRASDMSYLLTLIEFILTISSWIIVKTYPIWFRNFMKSFFSLPNSKFRSWISSVWSFSSCFLKSFSTIDPSASSETVNARKTDFGLQFLFLFQTPFSHRLSQRDIFTFLKQSWKLLALDLLIFMSKYSKQYIKPHQTSKTILIGEQKFFFWINSSFLQVSPNI